MNWNLVSSHYCISWKNLLFSWQSFWMSFRVISFSLWNSGCTPKVNSIVFSSLSRTEKYSFVRPSAAFLLYYLLSNTTLLCVRDRQILFNFILHLLKCDKCNNHGFWLMLQIVFQQWIADKLYTNNLTNTNTYEKYLTKGPLSHLFGVAKYILMKLFQNTGWPKSILFQITLTLKLSLGHTISAKMGLFNLLHMVWMKRMHEIWGKYCELYHSIYD